MAAFFSVKNVYKLQQQLNQAVNILNINFVFQ